MRRNARFGASQRVMASHTTGNLSGKAWSTARRLAELSRAAETRQSAISCHLQAGDGAALRIHPGGPGDGVAAKRQRTRATQQGDLCPPLSSSSGTSGTRRAPDAAAAAASGKACREPGTCFPGRSTDRLGRSPTEDGTGIRLRRGRRRWQVPSRCAAYQCAACGLLWQLCTPQRATIMSGSRASRVQSSLTHI